MSEPPPALSAAELLRLAELAERLREGTLPDAAIAELDSLLAESPSVRATFVALAMVAVDLDRARPGPVVPLPHLAPPPRPALFVTRRWRPLAAAAGLALAAWASWRYAPRSTAHGGPIATVSNASGAVRQLKKASHRSGHGATMPR